MSTLPDLNQVERKAYRSFYQDGLWDLYLGALLTWLFSADLWIGELSRLPFYAIYLGGAFVVWLLFYTGRRFITIPRLGQVRFGAARRARKLKMIILLPISIALNLGTVVFALLARQNPALQAAWVDSRSWMGYVISAIVGITIAVLGYLLDFDRLMLYAPLWAISFILIEYFDTQLGVWLTGGLSMLVGLVLLIRFLILHPKADLPPLEDE
jgi:hypothetical protein